VHRAHVPCQLRSDSKAGVRWVPPGDYARAAADPCVAARYPFEPVVTLRNPAARAEWVRAHLPASEGVPGRDEQSSVPNLEQASRLSDDPSVGYTSFNMKPPTPKTSVAKSEKINKSAFVRSLPATMSAQDVVKAAAAKGIKLGDKFVHTIRYNAKASAAKRATKSAPASVPSASAPAKRGPGRPPKVAGRVADGHVGNGLVAEIERIVEAKLTALLKQRLGAV